MSSPKPTDSRSNWHAWSTAYATAPPSSCQTLRNINNVAEWGRTCVSTTKNRPTPFSINTACMPWVTANEYPSSDAFYSPATACPTSWSAVSTASPRPPNEQWLAGETGLTCCPPGFEGDGSGGCRVPSAGRVAVVDCDDENTEEKLRTLVGAAWPTSMKASVAPLNLRYRTVDVAKRGPGKPDGPGGPGALSLEMKAVIGVVVSLVVLIGAVVFFLMWRRRRQKKAAMALAARDADEKAVPYANSVNSNPPHHQATSVPKEMDASESAQQEKVSELEGMARRARKPVPPVELDGKPIIAELGDAYIPYRHEKL